MSQGEKTAKLEIAKRLIEAGFDNKAVADMTKLSMDEVQELLTK